MLCNDCHLLFEECNKKGILSHSETQCHEKHFEGSLQGDKGCDI